MLPILNYHILYDKQSSAPMAEDEAIYANELQKFQQYIKYLRDNQYQGIPLDDYINSKTNLLKDLSKNQIIITFDDGHISIYTIAMPILLEYGFPAVFFITVKNIGTSNGVSWQQLREMADNGMSIQSHTMTHPFLSDLPPKEIRWELQESKTILEQQLGQPVDYLSLPGGRCNSTVKNIAMEVGYKAVCTSIVGYNDANTDPYSLKRWVIKRNMKLSTFSDIVHRKRSTLAYYKTRYFMLSSLKRVLGNRIYASIHREFTSKRIR
jgi:peptidoglycan/xylan/chitin deacetylase (PgdA/CDA1 family)